MIRNIEIIPYKLEVKKEFQLFLNDSIRSGYIVKIKDEEFTGLGDIAPLPNYSIESMKEIPWLLEELKQMSINLDDMLECRYSFQPFFVKAPSFRFGIETAIYDILSKRKNVSIAQLINKNYNSSILLNGLYIQKKQILNSEVIKIKITTKNIFFIKDILEKILSTYPSCKKLRLDFNGSLDLPRAIRVCKELDGFPIDYIEQPINNPDLDDYAELKLHTNIPIAIDEHANRIEEIQNIIDVEAADVIIIKPTLVGGFYESGNIINMVRDAKLRVILTSTYESNIGLMACAHIAAAYNIQDYCGLHTDFLFNNNVADSIIDKNLIEINKAGLGLDLKNNVSFT